MSATKGRWQLLAIAALFLLPTLGAMVMVFSDWRPGTFTNNGDLVQPPVQLQPSRWERQAAASEPLAGDWLLVLPRDTACGAQCRERLDTVTRIRVALDRDIDRVRLIVLQPRNGPVDAESLPAGIELMAADPGQLDRLLRHEQAAMAAHIVDYRGFHVMRYAKPLDAEGLLDDLEKLLRLAKEEAERRALQEATAE